MASRKSIRSRPHLQSIGGHDSFARGKLLPHGKVYRAASTALTFGSRYPRDVTPDARSGSSFYPCSTRRTARTQPGMVLITRPPTSQSLPLHGASRATPVGRSEGASGRKAPPQRCRRLVALPKAARQPTMGWRSPDKARSEVWTKGALMRDLAGHYQPFLSCHFPRAKAAPSGTMTADTMPIPAPGLPNTDATTAPAMPIIAMPPAII